MSPATETQEGASGSGVSLFPPLADLHKELRVAWLLPWLRLQSSSQQSRALVEPLVTCLGCSLVLVLQFLPQSSQPHGARSRWEPGRHWQKSGWNFRLRPSIDRLGSQRTQCRVWEIRDNVSLLLTLHSVLFHRVSSSLHPGPGQAPPVSCGVALVHPRPLGWSMEARGHFQLPLIGRSWRPLGSQV